MGRLEPLGGGKGAFLRSWEGDYGRINRGWPLSGSPAVRLSELGVRQLLVKTDRDQEDRVRPSVKDVGVGFTPEADNKLFEAFYKTKKDGMGIGLSVSRSIIESHHGRLWATANDGPGVTFGFSIPYRAGNAEALVNRIDLAPRAAGIQNAVPITSG